MSDDPDEALHDLAENPFCDLRDAAQVLPAVLAELSKKADALVDALPYGDHPMALGLAQRVDQVSRHVRTLAANTPPRPVTSTVPPVEPWQWSWPDELRVGMKIRFPKDEGGFGPWRAITAVPTQFYAAWGRAFYLDDDEHVTNIGNKRMVQTLLTDPDAVADFYAGKRDRAVQP